MITAIAVGAWALLYTFLCPPTETGQAPEFLQVSPDGRHFAIVSGDRVRLGVVGEANLLKQMPPEFGIMPLYKNLLARVLWSPRGRFLMLVLSERREKHVVLYDVMRNKRLRLQPSSKWSGGLALVSPDERFIALLTADNPFTERLEVHPIEEKPNLQRYKVFRFVVEKKGFRSVESFAWLDNTRLLLLTLNYDGKRYYHAFMEVSLHDGKVTPRGTLKRERILQITHYTDDSGALLMLSKKGEEYLLSSYRAAEGRMTKIMIVEGHLVLMSGRGIAYVAEPSFPKTQWWVVSLRLRRGTKIGEWDGPPVTFSADATGNLWYWNGKHLRLVWSGE